MMSASKRREIDPRADATTYLLVRDVVTVITRGADRLPIAGMFLAPLPLPPLPPRTE